MIPGIELLYQRIADAMIATLPDGGWSSAEFHSLFYPDSSTYEAEYVRPNGTAASFLPASDGDRAVRELRRLFGQAGQPVWGQVRFRLRPDGSFDVWWGYEGCDASGDLRFDEATESRRHEERRRRLIAGRPREA